MFKTLTIFFCALLCISSAHAKSASEYVSGELISSTKKDKSSSVIRAGLHLKLVGGWYTYWRMAGDNGLPPKFDWSQSTNVKDIKINWPTPARYTLMDMHSFGYSGEVLFPLDVTLADPAVQTTLVLKLDIIACHEICVPQSLILSHDVGTGTDSKKRIDSAVKKLPLTENSEKFGMKAAVLSKDAIVVTAHAQGGFSQGADLIFDSTPPLLFSPPEIILDNENPDTAILKLKAPQGMDLTKELFGKSAKILFIHQGQAVEQEFSF